jgi:acyl-CoA synthetase (AMP-forming)/AMP-acid ligase II
VEQPLTYLKQRAGEDWLIGHDSCKFSQLSEQLFLDLTPQATPPKILLAEQDPVRFLASFIAACAAGCHVFLCNPNWVEQEWQQVVDLVQPDLILGQLANPSIPLPPPSPPLPLSHSALSTQHPALIMIPTGGSSGQIRFAIHTWDTLMASVRGFHQYFGEKPINSFCVLPLYHVSGLMQFLRSFTTGGRMVILPFKALAAGEGLHIDPTSFFISLVPTQLAQLISSDSSQDLGTRNPSALQSWEAQNKTLPLLPPKVGRDRANFSREVENLSPNLSPTRREALNSPPSLLGKGAGGLGLRLVFPHDVKSQGDRGGKKSVEQWVNSASVWLSNFQTVLLGGAPAWAELLEQARRHRIPLALTYGMTETASQVVTLQPEAFLAGNNSCGQVLPHAQVTIRSSTGELLGSNQTGIITIQADSLTLGYYPEFFPNSLNLPTFQTDDLGFFDEQGYLTIIGRRSNKIITGGENVFPAEVEAAILATQLVADVCVIGLPDQYWGQVVTAVYVPSSLNVFPASLRAAVEDKLSKFKRPKYWVPVESLPRNPQGKVNYEQLKKVATHSLLVMGNG